MSVPAWPMPSHQAKLMVAKPQATGWFTPPMPIPFSSNMPTERSKRLESDNEINKLIWPSPGGIGVMDELLWNQTVKVATDEGILNDVPTQGAFRTDLAEEAVANLRDAGVDVIGDGWAPVTVELKEGGE